MTDQCQLGDVCQRWITGFCLLCLLVFAFVEAVHVHPDQAIQRNSGTPCLICFSVHANAPVVTPAPQPTLVALAIIAVPYDVVANGIASRLELFTRPPPIA